MYSLFDWTKLYETTPETRTIVYADAAHEVELPTNIWAWLDHFRREQSVEDYLGALFQRTLAAGDRGNPAENILLWVVKTFQVRWQTGEAGSTFDRANDAHLKQASLYLPSIMHNEVASEDPEFWWDSFTMHCVDVAGRVLVFDGETREVVLEGHEWFWIDLTLGDRSPSEGYAPYIAHADEAPEAAARALRALARATFEKGRKAAEPGSIFDPRFTVELDAAAILLGIDASA
ncbi:hypothetical protein [Brevundimonas sp.]|jgi:hypothetical protein|uniref:hypothetical protein n=1 Tax=Brevundimonas sp. TaxID=1871086 RepID=UPI002E14EE7B|nr:hypothetical protein [Brevundimonas sp.]